MANTKPGYTEIKIPQKFQEDTSASKVVEIELDDIESDLYQEVPETPEDTPETATETVEVEETPEVKAPKDKKPSRSQKRIQQLHQEREQARQEAEELRRKYAELQNKLNETSSKGQEDKKTQMEQYVSVLSNQLKEAIRSGDNDTAADLQEKLIDAKVELAGLVKEISKKPAVEAPDSGSQDKNPRQTVPQEALDWIEEYPIFNTDPIFYASTIAVNNQMLKEGWDPKTTDFYEELSERLAPRFPEVFGKQAKTKVQSVVEEEDDSSDPQSDEDYQSQQDVKAKAKPSKARNTEQTVSGSSRPAASSAPRSKKSKTVTLSPEDIAQAERWGLSLEQMARRIIHMETNKRDDGYSQIQIKKNKE